jgi:hypothetical protein
MKNKAQGGAQKAKVKTAPLTFAFGAWHFAF